MVHMLATALAGDCVATWVAIVDTALMKPTNAAVDQRRRPAIATTSALF
jgi:hypothetical protein